MGLNHCYFYNCLYKSTLPKLPALNQERHVTSLYQQVRNNSPLVGSWIKVLSLFNPSAILDPFSICSCHSYKLNNYYSGESSPANNKHEHCMDCNRLLDFSTYMAVSLKRRRLLGDTCVHWAWITKVNTDQQHSCCYTRKDYQRTC